MRPRRSALFMPASNARAIEKARGLECDVVILDLEDAVSPDQKALARDQAVAAVRAGGFGRRELVVRANGLDSEWGADDLAAIAGVAPDAVLLPKVSSPDTLRGARAALGAGPALWAMIETCRGIVDLPAIVAAAEETGLAALVLGPNDLAKEMRCRPGVDRAPLLPAMTNLVLCARMAGIAALDGVCNAIDDPARVEAECRQGLAWGFEGKTLIHPSQIAPANAVFSPSDDEVAWARAVVTAFDDPANAGKGAIRVEGRMVELLHRDEARRTLAIAEAVAG
ncbi:CoA ester lyase [Sphingomonas sp. CL5.1]|uniref:HpcH/HpaI aldolase/citrate lyase family protein n=1 Tax=Sphingomonas sp. CL5.1 TaxID=2653203 RepID=UPI00267143D7|nr:CoA ester lyase [Sphingomonas sp. CL5.1]